MGYVNNSSSSRIPVNNPISIHMIRLPNQRLFNKRLNGLAGFDFNILNSLQQLNVAGFGNYFIIPDTLKNQIWAALKDGSFNPYGLVGRDDEGNIFIKFDALGPVSPVLHLLQSFLLSQNWNTRLRGISGIIENTDFVFSSVDEDADTIICNKNSDGVLLGGLLHNEVLFYPELKCPIIQESKKPEQPPTPDKPGTPATPSGACPCDCQEISATEQWYLMKQCQGADCYPVNVNTKRTECKPVQQKKIFDIPCEQLKNITLGFLDQNRF